MHESSRVAGADEIADDASMSPPFESIAAGRTVACVDIGGTKVAVALATQRGFVSSLREPTATTGRNDALARQVIRMLGRACTQAGVEEAALDAVGICSTGPFVRRDGMIEVVSPNVCGALAGAGNTLDNDWQSAVLERPLRERYRELRIDNDGIGALVAERRWGALQGIDHCAYVTWSTGVGTGLCVDGRVLRGKAGNAGHAGHSFVNDAPQPSLCGCGNVGDVEAQVGGAALARRLGMDTARLMAAARNGDPQARAAVDHACLVLGRLLYNLVATLDLQRVSLGGAVFLHNRELLLPKLQAQLTGRLPALTDEALLVPAGLGLQVGEYGALALVA